MVETNKVGYVSYFSQKKALICKFTSGSTQNRKNDSKYDNFNFRWLDVLQTLLSTKTNEKIF